MTPTSTRCTESPLAPYVGALAREHRPNQARTVYGGDQSGEVRYEFNAQGYRGASFDPEASRRVFFVGDSHTIGVGLPYESAWPCRFLAYDNWSLGERSADVNLLNFGQAGASNDTIARMALTQIQRLVPDLVVVLFTHRDRAERLVDGAIHGIGSWILEQALRRPAGQPATPVQESAELYYGLTGDAQATLETLKNILLVQFACRSRGIPLLASWIEHDQLERKEVREHPILGPLAAAVDRTILSPFSLKDEGMMVDRAADGSHAGPLTHLRFARRLADFWHGRQRAVRSSKHVASRFLVPLRPRSALHLAWFLGGYGRVVGGGANCQLVIPYCPRSDPPLHVTQDLLLQATRRVLGPEVSWNLDWVEVPRNAVDGARLAASVHAALSLPMDPQHSVGRWTQHLTAVPEIHSPAELESVLSMDLQGA